MKDDGGMTLKPGLSIGLASWNAPASVELSADESTLVYDQLEVRLIAPGPAGHMLRRFVALSEAGPDAIRDVAQGWGPLALDGEPLNVLTERVKDWRLWAGRVRALLNFAGELHKGKIPDPGDRRVLWEWDHRPSWPVLKRSPEYREAVRACQSNAPADPALPSVDILPT